MCVCFYKPVSGSSSRLFVQICLLSHQNLKVSVGLRFLLCVTDHFACSAAAGIVHLTLSSFPTFPYQSPTPVA